MGNDRDDKKFSYAAAPYNFIPFPDKVVYRKDAENLTHEKIDKDLKSGYIDYSIKTLTPLFIDNGKDTFFNIEKKYTIPASTIRGKIYSNAEILSFSYPQFIKDKKFWHRGCFEDTILKEVYDKKVKPNKNDKINKYVRAGYLKRINGKWAIQPSVKLGEKNFEIIKEQELTHLKKYLDDACYMYNDEKYNNKNMNKDFWNEISKLKEQTNEKHKLLDNYSNKGFQPYFRNVTYYVLGKNSYVKHILGDNYRKFENVKYGMLMNSNNLSHKQVHYLIYEEDITTDPIEIKQDIMNQYNINVKLRQNGEIEGFNLGVIKRRKRMPIFYIVNDNEEIIAVGFTPYLKIPYENSIKKLIKINTENQLDYVQSIFGCCNARFKGEDNYALKGRVSFTNAKLVKENNKDIKFIKTINKVLSEPKPTSFQLYLKQKSVSEKDLYKNNKLNEEYVKKYKKELNTYEQDSELRGSKFYWLKDGYDDRSANKSKINSSIKAIEEGYEFRGRIYFKNLKEEELGLILMAIKPFENAKDSLGQGKPYGFGKVEFKIEDLKELDNENRFKTLDLQFKEGEKLEKKIESYSNKFIEIMKSQYHIDLNKSDRIKAFKYTKLIEKDINKMEFNYMPLTKFKNRELLKDISMYINEGSIIEKEVAATTEDNVDEDAVAKLLAQKFKVTTIKK